MPGLSFVNWACEVTTTEGVGALTLAQAAPVAPATLAPPRVSTLPVGTKVRYHINVTTGAFETGIGTIGAGNTLSRAPTATWDGTNYVSSGATALDLPAGTHRVLCDVAADDLRFVPTTTGVVHIHPEGDDATAVVGDPNRPFATVYGAIAGRGTATKFCMWPGTYNFGANYCVMPSDTSFYVIGGRAKWTFDGSQNFNNEAGGGGCAVSVAPGTGNVYLTDVDVEVGYNGVNLIGPIGIASWAGGLSTTTYPTLWLERCKVVGVTDILYGVQVKKFCIRANHCQFYSNWDVIYASGGCDFEINNTDIYWSPKRDTYNQGDSAFVLSGSGVGKVALNSGTFFVDTSSNNTTANRQTWRGIFAQGMGGNSRFFVGDQFKRVNVNTIDRQVPSFMGTTTSGCVVTFSGGRQWPVTWGTAQLGGEKAPALNVDGEVGFRLGYNTGLNAPCQVPDAAALTQTFPLMRLPPGGTVKSCYLHVRAAMAGTPTAATIEVGVAGNTTKFLAATTVKSTGQLFQVASGLAEVIVGYPYSGTNTEIIATLRTTGGNVVTGSSMELFIVLDLGGMKSDWVN